MVALVVVADARVRADDRRRVVDPVGVDLGRDERRAVPEGAGVEDRRQLAEHPELLHARRSVTDLLLGEPESLAEHRERPGLEREVPLHRVEQLAIEHLEFVVAHRRSSCPHGRRRPGRGLAIQLVDEVGAGSCATGAGSVPGGPVSVAVVEVSRLERPRR